MPAHWDDRTRVADIIASKLKEKRAKPLILRIIKAWGIAFVMAQFAEAQKVEAAGGLLTPDGVKRTPGGVFFKLVKDLKREEPKYRDVFWPKTRKKSPAEATPQTDAPSETPTALPADAPSEAPAALPALTLVPAIAEEPEAMAEPETQKQPLVSSTAEAPMAAVVVVPRKRVIERPTPARAAVKMRGGLDG